MSNEKITKIYRHQYDIARKKVEITEEPVIEQSSCGSSSVYKLALDTVFDDSFGHLCRNPLYLDDNHLPVMYDSKPNPPKYIELLIESQEKVVKASRKKYEEDSNFLEGLKTVLGETIHRPCPYCGKNEGELHKKTKGVPKEKFYVSCNNCGAQTHLHSNKDDAINEWNTGSCR